MIQLASRLWKLSIAATLGRLTSMGYSFPDEVLLEGGEQNYVRDYVNKRETMIGLRKMGLDQTAKGTSRIAAKIRHRLSLHNSAPRERWDEGPGKLFGVLAKGQAELAIHPDAHVFDKNTGAKIPRDRGEDRLFKGTGWKDVLSIPFYNLPEQICGFLFVGRDCQEEDRVYQPVMSSKDGRHEGGLAFVPTLTKFARQGWHGEMFAVANPVLALKLHARHFRVNRIPLPLLSWMDQGDVRTELAWHMVDRSRLIVWSPNTLDHRAVRQAAYTDSQVSLTAYASNLSPERLLARTLKHARPWHKVVAGYVDEVSDVQAMELLFQSQLGEDQIRQVLGNLTRKSRERVVGLLARQQIARSVELDGKVITERNSSWYVTKKRKQHQILDAAIRIDEVVKQRKSGRIFYRGKIHHEGTETPFCELKDVFQTKTLRWLEDHMLNRASKIIRGDVKWSYQLPDLAMRFSNPAVRECEDAVGWDAESESLVLPKFILRRGGEVVAKENSFSGECPGLPILPPTNVVEKNFSVLTRDNQSCRILWATTACLLADILATPNDHAPGRTALVGEGGIAIGQRVSTALGCLERPLHYVAAYGSDPNFVEEHQWPRQYSTPKQGILSPRMREVLHEGSSVYGTPYTFARLLAMEGSWRIVKARDHQLVPFAALKVLGDRLIGNYLETVAARDFKIDGEGAWTRIVLDDLAKWVSQYADASVVAAAGDILTDETVSARDHLFYLINEFLEDSRLTYEHEGWHAPISNHRPLPVFILAPEGPESQGSVILPRESLTAAVRRTGAQETPEELFNDAVAAIPTANESSITCEWGRACGVPGLIFAFQDWERMVKIYGNRNDNGGLRLFA
jgi:hypothetical protein